MKRIVLFVMCMFTTTLLFSCNSNNKIYNEFNKEFDQIKFKIGLSDQIIFDMNIDMDILDGELLAGKLNMKSKFKVNKEPMYIEADIRVDHESNHYIYSQIDDTIYQYELVEDDTVITSRFLSVDDFENEEINGALGFIYDIENGTATIEDDYYIFTQKYEESLTNDDKDYLEDLYDSLGLSLDDVLNTDFTTKFKFNDNGFYMSYDLLTTIKMEYPNFPGIYKDLTVDAKIEYIFEIKEFELLDLDSFEHISYTMDDISHYSKLDKIYNYRAYNKFYKFKLDQGYYYFDTFNSSNSIHVNFYDKKHNQIDVEYSLDNKNNKIYNIKHNGDYYIEVALYEGDFALRKYNTENHKKLNVALNKEIVVNLNKQQYASMRFNNTNSIYFENIGDNDIELYSVDTQRYYIIPAKSSKYIFIGIGPIDVLFTNVGNNGDECKMKINEIKSPGVNKEFEQLEEIKTTPSEGYYIHGGYLTSPELKLIVEESGFYTFYTSGEEANEFHYSPMVYNGGYVQHIEENTFFMLPGKYTIILDNSSIYDFSYGRVYYEYEKYEVVSSYEIELEKTNLKPYENDFPTILLHKQIGPDYYKYYFTIDEDAEIITYNYINLYYENGDLVSEDTRKSFNLKPGRYYFIDYFGNPEEFRIAIKA